MLRGAGFSCGHSRAESSGADAARTGEGAVPGPAHQTPHALRGSATNLRSTPFGQPVANTELQPGEGRRQC